jgi:hypothetical protein
MKPVVLFGEGINAYSPAVSRQRRLNCFYDIRKDGDRVTSVLRGTPGTIVDFVLPTFPVRGWHTVNSVLYVVSGSVLYSVTSAKVVTPLGVLSSFTSAVTIEDNGVQLILVDGISGYVYTLVTGSYFQSAYNAAGSFGAITADANYPNGASSAAFLDGRLIVNRATSRQYYVSEQYDATHWTNVSSLPTFGTKENSSDLLVKVTILNGALMLWGSQSIEFWQDTGSFPNPFQRINGATQTIGLAALSSVQQISNTAIFLGQTPQGGNQVMMLNGYTPTRISTSDIDHIISTFSVVSDATSLTYTIDGHPMYQLTFPSANQSFIYDSSTGLWGEVQTGLALQARHYGGLGISFISKNYMADYSSGNVYRVRGDIYTDNGTLIKRQVVSMHMRGGGNMLGVSELLLDMETGSGQQNDPGQAPQVVLQVSRDGGRTFGPERSISFGKVGQYRDPRAIWRRLGSARDFVFQFTMTDPVKFTVMQGSVTLLQGQ